MRYFGSLEQIKRASINDLTEVSGIGKNTAESIYREIHNTINMANYLTILRILLINPVLIFATSSPSLYNWIALLLFVIAGVTDHLDGYIARKTGSTSSWGALLDLVADKLLIIITLFI